MNIPMSLQVLLWEGCTYTCVYSHNHSQNYNHLSSHVLELPGLSHRRVVLALPDPVVPKVA